MKKYLSWIAIAFLIFFVAYRPSAAANLVKSIGEVLLDMANGVGDFFNGLVS
ncbi:hypothetical protein HDA40_003016 [Hamadaea flava]|uniref:Uncharacterized protein n=1 Tax=Hamadaea flava TaxID=1742688 RepID=A0ABV8LLA8_9ACTN|nr:hypothetical protein [Hamadaea flava]MCP2324509.1 hypothetical protein [Hamadaea flava]